MRLCFALLAMPFVFTLGVAHAASDTEQKKPRASDVLKAPKRHASANPITDRFALRVLWFPASIDTQLRLDTQDGTPGTALVAEQDLGMADTKQEGRAEMTIRLRERNRLRVDYFKLSRMGDKIITTPINFGDNTFNINDRAQTQLEWRNLTVTYSRSFIQTQRFEVGVGLGVSLLEARARGDVAARNIHEHQEAVGAFPTLEVDGTWAISKRWAFTARGQRYTANVNKFRGALADYHTDIQYRWRENFAFGLGYTKMHTLVDVGGSDSGNGTNDLTGRFDQKIDGPEFFIRASF